MNIEQVKEAEAEIRRLVTEVYVDERGKADPVFDGIISSERYLVCPFKMLWILKEPWDGPDSSGGGWSLITDQLATWPVRDLSQSTFHPIIYITFGVLKGVWDYDAMPWVSKMSDAEDVIRSIAFINAKKLPGATRGAHHPTILKWYRRGADIIDRQINAYSPEIVFGCAPHFREIMLRAGIQTDIIRSHGCVKFAHASGRLFLEVYHPGQTQVKRVDYVNDALHVVRRNLRHRVRLCRGQARRL